MAQDTGASQNANQEIDIDELEVDVLIVAKNPNNLKQTCAFLSRRGWPTNAIGNIQKAIEEIADKKPDIVMISLNHPSPAILKLPDIIAQSFNLICVGFVETNDATSSGKLASIKLRHKIHGSPSGPNFHRGLRKILAEKFNIKIDEKTGERSAPGSKSSDDKTVISSGEKGNDRTVISGKKDQRGAVVISGKSDDGGKFGGSGSGGPAYMPDHSSSGQDDGGSDKGGAIVQGGGDSHGHAVKTGSLALRQRSGSLFDDETQESENKVSVTLDKNKAGSGSLFDESDASADSGGGAESEDAEGKDVGSVIQMGRDYEKAGDKVVGQSKRKKLKDMTGSDSKGGGNMLFGENLDPAKPESEKESGPEGGAEVNTSKDAAGNSGKRSMKDAMEALAAAEAEAGPAAAEGANASQADMSAADLAAVAEGILAGQADGDGGPNAQGAANLNGSAPAQGAEVNPAGQQQNPNAFFEPQLDQSTPQGKMEQAVAKAMSEIFLPGTPEQNANLTSLTTVRRIGVFPIDSASLPGYVVIALEPGSNEDHALFLKRCESGLRANLQQTGVTGTLEPGFWLDIPEVSFEQWTAAAGRFKFEMNHQGREVGVSFFQTAKPIAKAQPSEHKEMLTVALSDISTEEPVTFKAYLHLKENDKFYLYLRDGRQLQPEQKLRLAASGMSNVFMKDGDVENFRMFLAASYLKETIRTTKSSGNGQQAA